MIKGVTIVRQASTSAVFDKLSSFFSALGFEPGKGWSDEMSRGASFLAPLGNIEFVDGMAPAEADILIEVTDLNSVHRVAAEWFQKTWGAESNAGRIGAIEPTHWRSRLFTAQPLPGVRFGFWAWEEPAKNRPVAIEGDLIATGMRFAIVVARWNAVVTERLLQGALDALLRSGARREDVDVIRVPGSYEVPMAARTAAETRRYDAVIALGCLLRGETAHYEAIYNEAARGIGQSAQETGVPHSFGVLTCETLEQALDRAGLKMGNKGFEAAVAAIEMASVTRRIRGVAEAESRDAERTATGGGR